jgi:hypothetical protein
MLRFLTLCILAACEAPKIFDSADSSPTDTVDTGGGAADMPMLAYDVHAATQTAALSWSGGMVPFAGYSGTGSPDGIYLADPFGDGSEALIYRIPWTADGALIIEDTAEAILTTGYAGPDKIGYEQGHLSIPDAAADVGDILAAGVGYTFASVPESGDLGEQATVTIRGDVADGYAARILWLDADLDGAVDDIAATQGRDDTGTYHGVVGIFLDTVGVLDFADADLVLDACQDVDGSRITYGAVDLALDSDGYLWASCPAGNYHSGTAEAWSLPLEVAPASVIVVDGVGGWTVEPDPNGGVWLGSQGDATVTYANVPSGTVETFTTPDEAESYFGAAPVTLQTSTGQTLLAIGMQARSTSAALTYDSTGRFAPGEANPAFDGGGDEADSAVYLCDITDGRALNEDHCARYTPTEAVPCIGAVQGMEEIDGSVYLMSSGWLYGSGTGCGAQIWRVDPVAIE